VTDPDIPSAYVRDKRTPTETREQLRARIPGWGADLDPADRPSHPTLRPDNPVTETGVKAELTHGGLRSRHGRSDARHHVLDPVIVAGPWVAGAAVTYTGVRRLVRALRR
jgi:hypothetical protein